MNVQGSNATAPGISLGDFHVSLIRDGSYWWDGGAFFGVVPKTLWSRKTTADELNRIEAAFNCYLIQTGDHTILVETGGGDKMDAKARERMKLPAPRPLPEAVAHAGFDPEAIDIVINSHLHWDHCGWNTMVRGGTVQPVFPRARYFAPRGEWEHGHKRLIRDSVSYIDENYDPLVESGRMTLVGGDCEIAPGVWMRLAPGHTASMMIITAESRGRTFCFLSDMVPMAAHLQPTWVTAFDLDPLQTIESKIRWLTEAAKSEWICGFAHEMNLAFTKVAANPKTGFAPA